MARNFKNFFGLLGEKADPKTSVVTAFEETREGQPKAYIPNFFYKPPFGYPRYKDLLYYRKLAASIYVDMCETAIIDEVCSIEWDIVAEDKSGNEVPGKEKEVEIVQSFFENPNTNPESWESVVRMMLPDLLELNSGIMVKVFNSFGKMVEIVARDGSAFTKNPDVYGMYTNRADLILMKDIYDADEESPYRAETGYPLLQGYITSDQARGEGAYFQYGFNTGARPVPFGKREIVWFEKKLRTDDLYGRSAMEVLAKTVQTLIYAVEHNLEYFSDNSIPPGVLGLDGMSTADIKAFAQQWTESQRKSDDLGNWKKVFHKLAMVNKMPKFERLGFTNAELELIESQKWWSKMVWAAFGMTATELGFVEDAKGSANQIVQSSIAKKRIIYPLLKIISYYVNTQIIPEFGFEGIKYKYKIFDVDDETKKWGLYKLQTESALKTINEVRNTEGLDPVDWGEEPPNKWSPNQGNNFNLNDPRQQESDRINRENQDERNCQLNKPKKGQKPIVNIENEEKSLKGLETKPFAGYANFDACVRANQDKGNPEAYCATIQRQVEGKALGTQGDLTLQPGEEMDYRKLKKVIIDLLKDNEKKIIEILETQKADDQLIKIKGIDDIPGMIKKIFALFTFKEISDKIIKTQFFSGWENSEKQIDRNVQMNNRALDFLQEHTFDNIKGMTEEIANDLKAELERGIINGEGITKLKERVSNVFNVGENRAEMIARTETNRAENNGKLLAIKGSGLEYNKKWITHKDDRTSPICRRLDGQIAELDENFKDSVSGWEGQSPPSHVNCRSTIVFIDKEEVQQKVIEKQELELKEKKEKEDKLIDEEIKIKLDKKEAEIKEEKLSLLKRLGENADGRNPNLS